jgi:hypothetical protein
MHVLHINSENDEKKIGLLDKYINKGSHIFILVYMEGCGPCNATRPEWKKLESVLKDQYMKNDNLVIVDLNKDFLPKLTKNIGSVDGFPSMKYINNHGKTIEQYENSSIGKKDRSIDSFINWIESKINTVVSTSSPQDVYKRLKHKKTKRKKNRKQRGGKWSRKYKLSINCSKPKGFSQKQYCKYGRK